MDSPLLDSADARRPWRYVKVLGGLTVVLFVAVVAMGVKLMQPAFSWCNAKDFTKKSLKSVVDVPIFGVLANLENQVKFEASGVVVQNNAMAIVCDSSWLIPVIHDLSSVGRIDNIYLESHQKVEQNYLVLPEDPEAFPASEDSQWEAITWNPLRSEHIVVQEAIPFGSIYRAVVQEISILDRVWKQHRACPTEFIFDSDFKGFEGALGIEGVDERFFILGLCEGNHCASGWKGQDSGNGVLVIMELEEGSGPPNTFVNGRFVNRSSCLWKTVGTVHLPKTADFIDYSDIARLGNKIAITSQESSALFVAPIVLTADGKFDPKTFEIGKGEVHYFSPGDQCETNYCNVEGIDFLSDHLFVAVSDQMKKNGRQEFTCQKKDQSIHLFSKKR